MWHHWKFPFTSCCHVPPFNELWLLTIGNCVSCFAHLLNTCPEQFNDLSYVEKPDWPVSATSPLSHHPQFKTNQSKQSRWKDNVDSFWNYIFFSWYIFCSHCTQAACPPRFPTHVQFPQRATVWQQIGKFFTYFRLCLHLSPQGCRTRISCLLHWVE